jgi:hypothetical protein
MGKEEALSIVFASCPICLTITFIIRIGLKRYLDPRKYSNIINSFDNKYTCTK